MDDEQDDLEQGEKELPEVFLTESGPCVVCGKAGCQQGCFRCGKPVCMNGQDYQADSSCGSWLLDWWSNGAMESTDGNEFWCNGCLEEGYGKPEQEPVHDFLEGLVQTFLDENW